jgi:hypothetical protein
MPKLTHRWMVLFLISCVLNSSLPASAAFSTFFNHPHGPFRKQSENLFLQEALAAKALGATHYILGSLRESIRTRNARIQKSGHALRNGQAHTAASTHASDTLPRVSSTESLDQKYGHWNEQQLTENLYAARGALAAILTRYRVTLFEQQPNWETTHAADTAWHHFSLPDQIEPILELLNRLKAGHERTAIEHILKRLSELDQWQREAWKQGITTSIAASKPPLLFQNYSIEQLYASGIGMALEGDKEMHFLQWLLDPRSDLAGFETALAVWYRDLLALAQWDVRHRFEGYTAKGMFHTFHRSNPLKAAWQAGATVIAYENLYLGLTPEDASRGPETRTVLMEVPLTRVKVHTEIHQRFAGTSEREVIISGGPLKVVEASSEPFDREDAEKASVRNPIAKPSGRSSDLSTMVLFLFLTSGWWQNAPVQTWLDERTTAIQEAIPDFKFLNLLEIPKKPTVLQSAA